MAQISYYKTSDIDFTPLSPLCKLKGMNKPDGLGIRKYKQENVSSVTHSTKSFDRLLLIAKRGYTNCAATSSSLPLVHQKSPGSRAACPNS